MCRPIFSREEETVGEADLSRRKRVTTRLSFFYTGGQFSFLEHRGHDIPSRVYNCIKNFTLMLCSSNHSYEKKKKRCRFYWTFLSSHRLCNPRVGGPIPSLRVTPETHRKGCVTSSMSNRVSHCYAPRVPAQPKSNQLPIFYRQKWSVEKKKKHELRGVQIIKQSGYSVQYSSLSRMFLFVCFYSKWLP